MSSVRAVRESLHNTIELLNAEEARQVLEFAQRLQKKRDVLPTLKRLGGDPTFKIPSEGISVFRVVQPVAGKGIPASRLLVEDRR